MTLKTRRPPGHGKRKALAFAADILSLRTEGHTLAAIRDALEDAGVHVSISTVRREVLKVASLQGRTRNAASALLESALLAPAVAAEKTARRPPTSHRSAPSVFEETSPLMPGRAIAEKFVQGCVTNPLFLEEPKK